MLRITLLSLLLTVPISLQAQDAPFQVRDSAGVTIVENYAPDWQPGSEWTVAPDPLLSLGAGSDDLRYPRKIWQTLCANPWSALRPI